MLSTQAKAAAFAALAAFWPMAGTADPVAEGKAIAEQHCSRCHVVGDYNRHGGIGSTPSFQLLVNALPDWADRFETFHARRPHPAFVRVKDFVYPDPTVLPPNAHPVEIEIEDIESIRAFAETLKEQ